LRRGLPVDLAVCNVHHDLLNFLCLSLAFLGSKDSGDDDADFLKYYFRDEMNGKSRGCRRALALFLTLQLSNKKNGRDRNNSASTPLCMAGLSRLPVDNFLLF